MATATVADTKTRIETLADAAITTLLTGSEERIARSTLPAIEARPGADSAQSNGAMGTLVTREWELWLFVSEIVRPDSYDDVTRALEACYPYLDSVPDYFKDRPQLQDANKADPLVFGTTRLTSSGAVTTPYKDSKTYSAVRFSFNVTVMRP